MDSVEIIVTVSGILLIIFVIWFFFGKGKAAGGDGEKPYACPMHPWITSSDPGAVCSICGMKLVR